MMAGQGVHATASYETYITGADKALVVSLLYMWKNNQIVLYDTGWVLC